MPGTEGRKIGVRGILSLWHSRGGGKRVLWGGTLGQREILQAKKKPQIGQNAGEAKETRSKGKGIDERGSLRERPLDRHRPWVDPIFKAKIGGEKNEKDKR